MNQNNNEKQKKEFDDYYEAGLETIDTIIGVVVTLGLLLLLGLIAFILAPRTAHAETIRKIDTEKIIDLTNDVRASSSVPLLKENDMLNAAAKLKALDMAENNYFAHKSPTGSSTWPLIVKAGYDYKKAGENLAVSFSKNSKIVSAWWDSPTHKENMINPSWTDIGVGIAKGKKGKIYVVQLFAYKYEAQKEKQHESKAAE